MSCPHCGLALTGQEIRDLYTARAPFAETDLKGQRINSWTVLRRLGKTPAGHQLWLCRCDCGAERTISTNKLTRTDGHQSRRCRECWRSAFIALRARRKTEKEK